MNTRHCLKIVSRMNVLLLRELGEGVDPVRMLAEPVYARDVLLVCEAMRGSELADLASRFRRAMASIVGEAGKTGASRPAFTASRFLTSIFGAPSTLDPPQPGAAPSRGRGWFSRSRGAGK